MSNQRVILSINLKKLIDSKGIDQKILADHLNLSEMAVSTWVTGQKYPRMTNIQKMADYFGVKKSDLIEDKDNEPTYTSANYPYYPTSISAGLPMIAEPVAEYQTKRISLPDNLMGKWSGHKDIFVTRINGDSMDEVMPDGSLIAIKPIDLSDLKNGDMVVFSNDHDYSVKYYQRVDDKLIFKPSSTNQAHYDQTYNINDNITIHGKVVMYIVELD